MKYIFTVVCVCMVSVGGLAQRQRYPFCILKSDVNVNSPVYKYVEFQVKCPIGKKSDCNPIIEDCVTSWLNIKKTDLTHYKITVTDSAIVVRHPRPNVTRLTQYSTQLTDTGFNHFQVVDFLEADFYRRQFAAPFICVDSRFNREVNFESSTFNNSITLSNNTFLQSASFYQAKFKDYVLLNENVYNDNVSFNSAIFGKFTTFNETTFRRTPTFIGTYLPDTLNFRNVKFDYPQGYYLNGEKVDFSRSRLNESSQRKCTILISGTDVGQLLLPYDRFRLAFDSTVTYEEIISSYETLISSCKAAGMLESAQDWDIEYRKMQNMHKFSAFGYFINFFNERWWNFGYDRWRILVIWLPLFFLFFLTYNYWQIERLWSRMYQDTELGSNFKILSGSAPKPIFKNWRKRFSFAFFYTAVIYFGFKIRHESVNYNYTRGLLYLYLMYSVGTIHMAFAFSYILSAY